MTTTAEKIAIMQAFEEGKVIERRGVEQGHWVPSDKPAWNWFAFEYRVAPFTLH